MAPETARALTALAVLLAYAAFCGLIAWRAGRRRPAAWTQVEGRARPVLVAFASQTGFAEELAHRTAAALQSAAVPVRITELDSLDSSALAAARRALFLVSTTGEGDAPDSAARFIRQVMGSEPRLSGLEYGLLALGDSSYARFCDFGRQLDSWLQAQGASPLFTRIEADGGAADALHRWQAHVAAMAGSDVGACPFVEEQFSPWRLVTRELLNPNGLGLPVFRLAFQPMQDWPRWGAGDIAIVQAGEGPRREYSIASVPGDGQLELLVRQVRHADGRLGIGSGWLTGRMALGDQAMLRIRANRAFRAPEGDVPLVLVGNGTGIAGLRAHIRARGAAGRMRNWLLYGERSRAHDFPCGAEIEGWLANGVLARLDLAFSRQEPGRYVQDALLAAAGELRQWVNDGAAIMVCGSMQGMAPGVHAALSEILGGDALEELAAAGRYRRDVY